MNIPTPYSKGTEDRTFPAFVLDSLHGAGKHAEALKVGMYRESSAGNAGGIWGGGPAGACCTSGRH